MVFHWSLCDKKSPQVSRTLLSILAVLSNVVVWVVSTHPPTSKSTSPFNNPLVTVPKAPITNGIIVTFMFHTFFQFPSKVEVLILLFKFFQVYSVASWDSKVDNFANSLFFFFWLLLSLVFILLLLSLLLLLLLLLFTPWEFFTAVLADGLSLEFEWQQVFSSLQDFSQYSSRYQ